MQFRRTECIYELKAGVNPDAATGGLLLRRTCFRGKEHTTDYCTRDSNAVKRLYALVQQNRKNLGNVPSVSGGFPARLCRCNWER
jgi:hypothetical protein